MKLAGALLIAIVGAVIAQQCQAQSFNCRYAKTPDEVAICQNAKLAEMDIKMSKLYFGYRGLFSGRARHQIENDQAAWLRDRMICGSSPECIATAYKDRVAYLYLHRPAVCSGPILTQPIACDSGGSLDISDNDVAAVMGEGVEQHPIDTPSVVRRIEPTPPSSPPSSAATTQKSFGSGVVFGADGEVLTNAHVVDNCQKITIGASSASAATLIATDEKNDLAIVRGNVPLSSVVAFREGKPVRAGDVIVALGYPLSGLLATTPNISVGYVSALAGLGDDSRYLQISAPVQPGNSGGPLLDTSGHLVGIVTGKLNAAAIQRFTGDIPQNVNFALKVEVAKTFLDSKSIAYQIARSQQQLSPADVGEMARPFTVQIECEQRPDPVQPGASSSR